ncbi:MAG TPA: ATP-grasp domain-containing protein [Gaiellaceae bacterium]|nr:ATP-grasp domain-containing protein [Gaiellaceae bacterium]
MRVAVVGRPSDGNLGLVEGWRALGIPAEMLVPDAAADELAAGDVAVNRLDVLPSLDGVEPGLAAIQELGRRGVRVLNKRRALLAAHDKLRTAYALGRVGLPHPRTAHVLRPEPPEAPLPPVVVKPRYGSWGQDVWRCEDAEALARQLGEASSRRWFRHHGALVQELVPPLGWDVRLVVADGRVVGSANRHARRGDWRTNVSLGGSIDAAAPLPEAVGLALDAAAAVGSDLVGVDLLPLPEGGFTILELNAAVDFDGRYALAGSDVYADVADALGLLELARAA